MDAQKFKDAMSRWATGVSVVSSLLDGKPVGITVTGFMSLTVDPPSVLISIDNRSYMVKAIENTKKFTVSFLNEDQEEISRLFASHDLEKFNKTFTGYIEDVPYIKGGTVLLCELHSNQSIFDHTIFAGKVKDLIIGNEKPLIYWDRKYIRTI